MTLSDIVVMELYKSLGLLKMYVSCLFASFHIRYGILISILILCSPTKHLI